MTAADLDSIVGSIVYNIQCTPTGTWATVEVAVNAHRDTAAERGATDADWHTIYTDAVAEAASEFSS